MSRIMTDEQSASKHLYSRNGSIRVALASGLPGRVADNTDSGMSHVRHTKGANYDTKTAREPAII